MRLLHTIVEVIDRLTGKPNEDASHRIGRKVHVGELSLRNPAMLYYDTGVTVTSTVQAFTEDITGKLEIVTSNSIYKLEPNNLLK